MLVEHLFPISPILQKKQSRLSWKQIWKLSNKCKILEDNEHITPGPGASGLIVITLVPPPCSLTISQSENCEWSHQVPCDASSLICLLKCFAKTLQGAQDFLGHKPPRLLAWPCNKYFFAPNSDFQFVWPHCVLGTWTYINVSTFPFSLHFWVMKGKPYIFRVMCLLPDS